MIHKFSILGRTHCAFGVLGAVLTCATGALLSGCQGHNENSVSSGVGIAAPASANNMRGDDVVATVNNDNITSGELYDVVQHYVPAHVPGFPNNQQLLQPAGRVALQDLIVSTITLQLAKDNGVPVTSGDLDTSYQDQKMVQESKTTLPFETLLQNQGYTPDSYKQEVLAVQVAQNNLLQKTVTIAPSELQAAYNSNLALYTIAPRVHVHRIVCASKQDAQNVYSGLKAGQKISAFSGVNLAPIGSGGNPSDDTDLAEWLMTDQPKNSPLAPLVGTLKTAKPGDVLQPTLLQGQWWVMQVVDTKPKQVMPFDQVKDMVRINLVRVKAGQNAGAQLQNAMLQHLQRAQIKINSPYYQNLAEDLHTAGTRPAVPSAAAPPASAAGKPAAAPMVVPSAPGAASGKPVVTGGANKPH